MITVVIPVGPSPDACRYLPEALASIKVQTVKPREILMIDDMHGLGAHDTCMAGPYIRHIFYAPWNLGVAHAFNVGVAVAPTEHVLMLGADDWLEPDAIECAERAIKDRPIGQAYYWFPVRYSDDRPQRDQYEPCNAAVVTKALWRATGGFPVESAVGRPDVMLIGLLMAHSDLGTLVPIAPDGPPRYCYRVHDGTHTASRGPWIRALEETAQAYWATWAKPTWGRYE